MWRGIAKVVSSLRCLKSCGGTNPVTGRLAGLRVDAAVRFGEAGMGDVVRCVDLMSLLQKSSANDSRAYP